jgi:hypothetical protein
MPLVNLAPVALEIDYCGLTNRVCRDEGCTGVPRLTPKTCKKCLCLPRAWGLTSP